MLAAVVNQLPSCWLYQHIIADCTMSKVSKIIIAISVVDKPRVEELRAFSHPNYEFLTKDPIT